MMSQVLSPPQLDVSKSIPDYLPRHKLSSFFPDLGDFVPMTTSPTHSDSPAGSWMMIIRRFILLPAPLASFSMALIPQQQPLILQQLPPLQTCLTLILVHPLLLLRILYLILCLSIIPMQMR